MRFASILREAWLNLRSGTTRAGIFALFLTVVLGVLAGGEVVTGASLVNEASSFRAAGGSTLTYAAQGKISGTGCDALASVPTVVGAGALRAASTDEVATALPSTTIPTFDVSPTFGGFVALGRPPANRGVLISDELAAALRLHVGDRLHLKSGTTRVAGIYRYPQDGRAPGLGYAILIPSSAAGEFDQCWVEAWPQSSVIEGLLTSVASGGTAEGSAAPPVLAQLNGSKGATFEGTQLFDTRLTRFAPLIAALAGLVLGFVSVRIRRLELSSARHAGVAPADQFAQIAVESLTWIVGALAVVLAGIVVCAELMRTGQSLFLLTLGGRVLVAGGAAALLGALAGAGTATEKQLFRYFKER